MLAPRAIVGDTKSAPLHNDIPVYIGVWINWSKGRIQGSILTLSRRNGALLTAFLAIFIAYAGSVLWRLLCRGISLYHSSNGPRDGIYHQQQAVLRNASSPAAASWSFTKMFWAWTRTQPAARPYRRILPFVILCLVHWAIFSAASLFSSRITADDEVLISSRYCGRPPRNPRHDFDAGGQPSYNGISTFHLRRVMGSQYYVSACYPKLSIWDFSGHGGATCNVFVKPNLHFKLTRSAACPFKESLCTTQDRNLLIDARLNTRDDLGLNLPESMDLRWTTHCAPLVTSGYTEQYNHTPEQSYVKYYYGRRSRTNHTLMTRIRDFKQLEQFPATVPTNRELSTYVYVPRNGSLSKADSDFDPIEELKVPDSDIHLLFLNSNFASVGTPVNDSWYAAHRPYSPDANSTVYLPDEESSPLACKIQFQICTYGSHQTSNCTENTGLREFYDKSVVNSEGQARSDLLLRTFQALAIHHPLRIPAIFRSASVELASINVTPGMIGDIAWHNDVMTWQQRFLATIQGSFVDIAIGPTGGAVEEMLNATYPKWQLASSPAEKRFCQSQKIRSSLHSNFSVLWLSIILVLGVLAIIVEWSIEPLLAWRDTRQRNHRYSLLEWYANETLQLQRLAHEELGYGSWTNCADGVPVSLADEKLATLDVSNFEHLRLQPLSLQTTGDKPNSISEGSSQTAGNESDDQTQTAGNEPDVLEQTTGNESSGLNQTPSIESDELIQTPSNQLNVHNQATDIASEVSRPTTINETLARTGE